MNIVRKIHDLFRVKTVAGAQLETPEAVSSLGAGGSTFITIAGGGASLSGSGLSELDRVKLDSIELGALVNLDAFSKILFDATSIDENDLSSSSNSSIIANVPTDTANIKIVGNYPITVNLESVSLFNSNTSTTTGTAITTYNISFNDDNNIVIEYVDGALLNVADVELIQIKHKEDILATYLLSDITYTTSDGTITSFTIPYSNTDFSEIEFCKYETITTETETGSTTVRELRVLSTLPASPTKQSIITLNSLTDSFWNYEEDENGNKFVWTDYNVYSTKDVSAYGRGTDLGDTYASNLYELKDVVLTNLSNNDLLIYNSSTSKWVNINKDLLGISAGLLHTLTISVNGVTQAVYNPASANASVNISTITLDEVTEYIDQKIDTKLDASEFFKWFTINYDSNNNVVSIQANFDFYSIEGVSAYGLGEGEEEPSYVSELGLLSDVTLTNVALNNILLYDGNKWVNKPMSSIVVDAYTKSEIDTKLSSISSEVSVLKSNVTSILSNITTILNSISGITSDISTINATISDILTTLTGKLDKDDFFTWFTIIKNTSGEVVSILANFDFYSIGEVSAYGLGDIGGSGRTTLATLDDVSLSNLITNDMLAYNGSKWVNIPMSQVRGVTSWADLENKPTTLSGFGITDAYTTSLVDSKIAVVSNKLDNFLTGSDTDTIINKWKELESFLAGYTLTQTLAELLSVKANSSVKILAGTGLTGGGDLTANRTISLATSGVTAGTYTKVTVDAYGRVTSGSTLSASDIPNLDWSKITSGKPTTLAGYGITDGVNSVIITGTGNAITAATITDHILTLTKGNTFLQQSIFDDLFEKVNIGTTASPVYAIKAKYHFYSVGEVSAYEFGDTSEGGSSTLAELADVLLTSLSSDQILKYNGSKWINIPITEVKGATSWDEIEDKPSTFTPSAHTHTVADITDISPLVLNVNGSSLFTYNGKSSITANLTVPTKVSQLTNDSGYLTAITKTQVEGVLTGNVTSHTHSYLPLTGGRLAGNLEIDSTGSLWNEGIRIHAASNGFCGVILCGLDNTGSSGTSATTWSAYNSNGNFYINRNASIATSDYILCNANGNWGIGTNSPSSKLHVVGDIYTTTGFKKNGSSDSYVLLGGGGHKALTDFAMASDYIKKASDTFWGTHTYTGSSHIFETTSADTLTIFKHTGSGIPVPFKVSESSSTNESSDSYGVFQIERLNTANGWNNAGASLYFNLKDINGDSAEVAGISGINTSDGKLVFRRRSRTVMGTMDSTGLNIIGGYSGTSILLTSSSRKFITFNQTTTSEANNGPWILCQLNGTNKVGIGWNNTVGMFFEHYYNSSTYALLALGNSITYNGWSLLHSNNYTTYTNQYFKKAGDTVSSNGYIRWADASLELAVRNSRLSLATTNQSTAMGMNIGSLLVSSAWADSSKVPTNGIYTKGYISGTGFKLGNGFHIGNRAGLRLNSRSTEYPSDILFGHKSGDSDPYDLWTNVYWAISARGSGEDYRFSIWRGSALTSEQEFVTFTKELNVGIGTTNPTQKLYVNGLTYSVNGFAVANGRLVNNTVSGNGFIMQNGNGTNLVEYSYYNDHAYVCNYYGSTENVGIEMFDNGNFSIFTKESGKIFYALNNGKVGIGTTSPSVKLHVIGDIAATGAVTAKASSSDIRLKTDITDYKALSIIRSHKSIKYHWNEVAKANANIFNDDYWHYGLIAQDVQRDMPQMVSDVFKDYLVINYERLIPICWKGLQEVDDEVTKLKKRVKQLEKRLLKYEST